MSPGDEQFAQRVLTDSTWRAVQATLGAREVIQLCLLIGNYQGLASTIGGLGIQIEPDSTRVVPSHRGSTISRSKAVVRLARPTKAT